MSGTGQSGDASNPWVAGSVLIFANSSTFHSQSAGLLASKGAYGGSQWKDLLHHAFAALRPASKVQNCPV